MVYVALAEAVCIVVLGFVLLLLSRAFIEAAERQHADFREERADLLNAARHPGLVLSPRQEPVEHKEPSDEELEYARNFAIVGTVA